MCLIGLALGAHADFPVVIAANRDEFHDRPAAPLKWWLPAEATAPILAGRDLSAGGTWIGLARNGRIGLVTNVRAPSRQRAAAPSRGALVPAWLAADGTTESHWSAVLARGCNPFNFIGGDLARGAWWWGRDDSPQPRELGPGIHGLSNAALDTPWPKVRSLKAAIEHAMTERSGASLTTRLFDALANECIANDSELPDTGIGIERERWLSPVFIRTPDGRYGTRCSTVLLGRRVGAAWQVSVTERSFDAAGRMSGERCFEVSPGATFS